MARDKKPHLLSKRAAIQCIHHTRGNAHVSDVNTEQNEENDINLTMSGGP